MYTFEIGREAEKHVASRLARCRGEGAPDMGDFCASDLARWAESLAGYDAVAAELDRHVAPVRV